MKRQWSATVPQFIAAANPWHQQEVKTQQKTQKVTHAGEVIVMLNRTD